MIRFKQLLEARWNEIHRDQQRRVKFILDYLKGNKTPKILAKATKGTKTVLTLDDLHLGKNHFGDPYYYHV